MQEAMGAVEKGAKLGRELLKDVRLADEQRMVVNTKSLQKIMDGLQATAEAYGMKLKTKKTKVMRTCRKREGEVSIAIDGSKKKQVLHLKYLGSTLTKDSTCETQVEIKIALARLSTSEKSYLKSESVKKIKKKLNETLLWTR